MTKSSPHIKHFTKSSKEFKFANKAGGIVTDITNAKAVSTKFHLTKKGVIIPQKKTERDYVIASIPKLSSNGLSFLKKCKVPEEIIKKSKFSFISSIPVKTRKQEYEKATEYVLGVSADKNAVNTLFYSSGWKSVIHFKLPIKEITETGVIVAETETPTVISYAENGDDDNANVLKQCIAGLPLENWIATIFTCSMCAALIGVDVLMAILQNWLGVGATAVIMLPTCLLCVMTIVMMADAECPE